LDELRTVRAAFSELWAEILEGAPLDEGLTWSEAGVDSLKSLQLLLRLEEVLGTSLSFDLFARDLTPGDLIRSLSVTDEPARVGGDAMDQRTLFLVPGIYGDEPRLADFRKSLSDQIACVTLNLPELDCTSEVLSDMKATARALLDELVAKRPQGAIALGGYSFGGFVAYQIASDLTAAGREVELLCLLDPPPLVARSLDEPAATDDEARRSLWTRLGPQAGEGLYPYIERMAFRALFKGGRFELARRLARASWRNYDFGRALWRRRQLLGIFRSKAMRSWAPKPCSVPTLLVASGLSEDVQQTSYWSELCQNLTVTAVGGGHWGVFDPEPLARLKPALLRALGLESVASPKPAALRSP
jgi:thioesterase domain-containing protein